MEIVVKQSARQEFEMGRQVTDPEEVAKRLVTGHDCLLNIQERIRNPGLGKGNGTGSH